MVMDRTADPGSPANLGFAAPYCSRPLALPAAGAGGAPEPANVQKFKPGQKPLFLPPTVRCGQRLVPAAAACEALRH